MQHSNDLRRSRIIASIAATAIALACGSNYVYSAWAPQFAEKLKLSATESNLIGLFGNLGMYLLGVPIGMFIDNRGPRPAVLGGALLLAVGYFPLHQAYDSGSGSVLLLSFFSFLSGLGGCMAFAAAIKTSALNWPGHRGTATAFPLAAFGLSAFFFSTIGGLFFPGDTSAFLMLLAAGTCGITFIGFWFLKVHANSPYQAVSDGDDSERQTQYRRPSGPRRASSKEAKARRDLGNLDDDLEPGTSTTAASSSTRDPATPAVNSAVERRASADETSSLISSSDVEELVGRSSVDLDMSHRLDIRGFSLLRSLDFWQLWLIMAILAGIGIMSINNIGNNAKSLWQRYDKDVSREFLVGRQQMHVSILSIGSFLGRLSSGVGSDFLVKKMHASRVWCLVVATLVFFLAQACALTIEDPHYLVLVSSLSGIGYGFLFGVFPSIVAESFGIRGLSQNWGFMSMAPVISSNVYNLFYGHNFDKHSTTLPDGERVCLDGIDCYRSAYWMTFGACGVGLVFSLWVIHHQRVHQRLPNKGNEED